MVEQTVHEVGATELDGGQTAIESQQHKGKVTPATMAKWLTTHKPEFIIFSGMTLASLLVSGASVALLLSPNLGQTVTYDPLIDEATLAASRRTSLGDQLLGQVARVLELEIIETPGPEVGHRHRSVPEMTIVAQAEQATAMPKADLMVGLKAMVIATGVGLGVTGLMKWFPLSALGPRRRLPLSQRMTAAEATAVPLAPITGSNGSQQSVNAAQTLLPGALTSLRQSPVREATPQSRQQLAAQFAAHPSSTKRNQFDFLNDLDLRRQYPKKHSKP